MPQSSSLFEDQNVPDQVEVKLERIDLIKEKKVIPVKPEEPAKKELSTAELFNKFTKENTLPHVLRGELTLMSQLEQVVEYIRSQFQTIENLMVTVGDYLLKSHQNIKVP